MYFSSISSNILMNKQIKKEKKGREWWGYEGGGSYMSACVSHKVVK